MRLWKGKIKMLWAILSTLLVGAVAGWLASKIMGGGGSLGTVTVSDPGVRLLLANGLSADDVEVTLELPDFMEIYREYEAGMDLKGRGKP